MPVAIYSTRRRPDGTWTIRGAIGDGAELVQVTTTADLGDDPTIEDAAGALAAAVFVAPPAGDGDSAGGREEQTGADQSEAADPGVALTESDPGANAASEAPPAAGETFVELDGTVVAVLARLAEIDDAELLERIGAAERRGKSRKTVLAAIDGRLHAVSGA